MVTPSGDVGADSAVTRVVTNNIPDLAAQTEMIYTRNKEVWKATNRDTLEGHLIKECLPFSKDSVDAAHARYVAELQVADEAKAKEEARKAAEVAKTPPTPHYYPPTNH